MTIAERGRSLREDGVLSRPLFADLVVNWELVAYGCLVLIAIITRFWDLGVRALHHDESLHAIYAWYLYTGKGYTHDPMMHGPLQFEGVALMYLLFGASDYAARILAALCGIWVVIAPFFLRRELGRTGALVASVLLALSPVFLYFSRFARSDAYVMAWEMLVVVGLFGFLRERRSVYLYLFTVGVALLYATKETVFITGFAFFMFFVIEAAVSALRRRTPLGWEALRSIRPRDLSICIALFLAIEVVMYTTFFTNPKGLNSGTLGALQYWLAQQAVMRGGQPWYYYLMLLPLYEFLPVLAALGGLVFVIVRRQLFQIGTFAWFLIAWLLFVLLVYSWAGEKMPWLTTHIAQPLVFLAAMAIAGLLRRVNRDTFTREPGVASLLFAGIIAAAVLGGMVAAPPVAGTTLLGVQSAQLQSVAMWLLVLALVVGLVAMGRRHGSQTVLVPVGVGFLVALLALSVHTAWGVTYQRSDIPQDLLVYVQSSPDVPRVVREIERLSYQTGTGKDIKLLLDGGYTDNVGGQSVVHESISWPFEWYLRDYKGKSYFSRTFSTPTDAPVILSMVANEEPIRNLVGNYVPQKGRLNWWYPEDYKGLTLEKLGAALGDASVRAKLWRYFLYKELVNPPLGSRDFTFYVRSDLARGVPVQASVPPPAPAVPQAIPSDAVAQPAAGGITILGKTKTGASVLGEPHGLAVGPDGLVYVADTTASRVIVFNPDGTVAQQWGRKGSADGELNEPWSIAVAPTGEVYVADTWNHRIQKFDRTGKFLTKWGTFADVKGQLGQQPGSFWGPRDVAVAPNGNVLVTDTGNKRVQVFDKDGRFVSMFGGDGTDPGQLKEPVGIAVDPTGNIYVADTWNRRVQKFGPDNKPMAQFPVAAWDSQSVVNKPYLAVDREGRVFITDPEKHRFLVLAPDGKQEVVKGEMGSDPSKLNLPTGIAVSPQGELFIGDARNARVVKYQSWR